MSGSHFVRRKIVAFGRVCSRLKLQKMPVNNFNAFLGAAVLGVISAAGMFLVENYKQSEARHAMAKDLARLDQELTQLRKEIDQLLTRKRERSRKNKGGKSSYKANSVISASTGDDYLSASNLDSSDSEFYDVSDEPYSGSLNLENALKIIDEKLDTGSLQELEDSLEKLGDLCIEHPGNPELLWRIGKAHQKISDKIDVPSDIQKHVSEGIVACSAALKLKSDSADIHKWYAILVGARAHYVSLHERISDGHLFKIHIDEAVALRPTDPSLHHMLGKFNYEVAALKWYERKVASALFGIPPDATVSKALEHFMEAERLTGFDWKENKLMIAKCKIACKDYKEAVEWLSNAKNCKKGDKEDQIDLEVEQLLTKYNSN